MKKVYLFKIMFKQIPVYAFATLAEREAKMKEAVQHLKALGLEMGEGEDYELRIVTGEYQDKRAMELIKGGKK